MKRLGALLMAVMAMTLGLGVVDPARPVYAAASAPNTMVAFGQSSACALVAGGAYCWGYNGDGQLGDGTTTSRSTAAAVAVDGVLAGRTLSKIAVSNVHSCAVDSLGAAFCWGSNGAGNLGNGTTTNSTTPVAVSLPVGVTLASIATKTSHTCALTPAGAAYCWGINSYGSLGDGTTVDSSLPVAVDMSGVAGGAFRQISTGSHMSCALSVAGAAYCFGYNGAGWLGDGTTTDRPTPSAVSTSGALSGKTLVKISTSNFHSCALDTDGLGYCWGGNSSGQLGDNSTTDRNVPVAVHTGGVLAGKRLVDIAAMTAGTCALDEAAVMYCWGAGSFGGLGDGTNTNSSVPVVVDVSGLPAGTEFRSIAGGYDVACGQTGTGRTYCWGLATFGETGLGSTTNTNVPSSSVLSLPSLPGPPTGVTIIRSGTTAQVSWTPPADTGNATGALTGYTATASPGGASCTTTGTSCTLSGLSSSTTYTVSVRANSSIGSSAGDPVSGMGGGLADTGVRAVPLVVLGMLALWLGIRLRRLPIGRHAR